MSWIFWNKLLPLTYGWVFIKAHLIAAKEAMLVVDGHAVVVVRVVRVVWDPDKIWNQSATCRPQPNTVPTHICARRPPVRGVRYAKFWSIQYFININILQNFLILCQYRYIEHPHHQLRPPSSSASRVNSSCVKMSCSSVRISRRVALEVNWQKLLASSQVRARLLLKRRHPSPTDDPSIQGSGQRASALPMLRKSKPMKIVACASILDQIKHFCGHIVQLIRKQKKNKKIFGFFFAISLPIALVLEIFQ